MTPIERKRCIHASANAMPNELLQQLPFIIASGRQESERILTARPPAALETREWVLPAKDEPILSWIREESRRRRINEGIDVQPNRLIQGGDLQVMSALIIEQAVMPSPDGRIDLIYVDMPFPFQSGTHTNAVRHPDQSTACIAAYLSMLVPRLFLMRPLLSNHGLVFMRVSPLAKQYVKLVINDVFRYENSGDRRLIEFPFDESIAEPVKLGRSPGAAFLFGNGDASRIGQGICQQLDEKAVKFDVRSQERAASFRQKKSGGKLYAGPLCRSFSEENLATKGGVLLQDVGGIHDFVEESVFSLEAVILRSTQSESVVADFSGDPENTVALAERLGRRWITAGMNKSVCSNIRRQLIERGVKPFLYQAIANPSESADKHLAGGSSRTGDLMQTVLLLYGAVPLPSEDDPNRNLGQMLNVGKKTLVLVDSPDQLTGLPTLRNAIFQCNTLMGGWDKVVVLGWKFESSFDVTLASLHDSRLEVLVIPNDLLEILKMKNAGADLKRPVCFVRMPA